MTVDFTPFNLTAWGYQDCQYDPQDGSFGGLLTKLLFRTLPDYYPARSAYAHFPFLNPVYMEKNLEQKNPDLASKYVWTRPRPHLPTVPIDTFAGVHQVLTGPDFSSAYNKRLFEIVTPTLKLQGKGSDERALNILEEASKKFIDGTTDVSERLFSDLDPMTLAAYFSKKTEGLISSKSFKHVGKGLKYVDIVRDVINLLPVYWISQEIAGLEKKNDQDTYEKFAAVAQYVYLDTDPVYDWHLREAAQKYGKTIMDPILDHVKRVSGWIHHITNTPNDNCHKLIKNLWHALNTAYSREEIAAQIFAAVVPSAALYSQAVSIVVHYYLGADKKTELEEIIKLGECSDENASGKVMVYVYEALKQNPLVAGVYRTATRDVNVGPVTVKVGEQVFASISKAILDSSTIGPNVAKSVMWPPDGLMAAKFFEATVPAVLASIFRLNAIATGPGQSGTFNHFNEDRHGTQTTQYMTTKGLVAPWPDSLIVQYNE